MSSLRNIVLGCVSDRSHESSSAFATSLPPAKRPQAKVKFGVSLVEALKDNILPEPLVEILVYIAQEGVTTTDLFRRPGNSSDLKVIMKKLSEGKEIQLTSYNFYTLASVVKKFLLKIPGGIFGPDAEVQLLRVLDVDNRMQQYDIINSILMCFPSASQKLITLLFGIWFRIVNHSEYNTMSSESVAKSVAGSVFHTCADDPVKVNTAVHVLQILIDDFGVGKMFGRQNLQFFSETTRTRINVREKYRFELGFPDEHSIEELADYLPLFVRLVHHDVLSLGLNPTLNAITKEEFYNITRVSEEEEEEMRLYQPSPSQSLQPNVTSDEDFNPHKKLTHMSSLSAPEVNHQGCCTTSPCDDHVIMKHDNKRLPSLSTSLNRFDSVKRRQLSRMRKRSNWFLSPSIPSSDDFISGFLDVSSSVDPTSSEEATVEGIIQMSTSDLDDNNRVIQRIKEQDEEERRKKKEEEESSSAVVAEHGLLTVSMATPFSSLHHRDEMKEERIQYFMVENFYGKS